MNTMNRLLNPFHMYKWWTVTTWIVYELKPAGEVDAKTI